MRLREAHLSEWHSGSKALPDIFPVTGGVGGGLTLVFRAWCASDGPAGGDLQGTCMWIVIFICVDRGLHLQCGAGSTEAWHA